MSHIDETNLTLVVESMAERGSIASAAGTIGCCEQTLFNWVHKSRKAEAAGDKETPFYFEWRDEWAYLHQHMKRARAENISSIEGLVRQQTKEGIVETVFSPATGYPLQALNPDYIGLTDDEMREMLLHPVRDRLMWRFDEKGDRVPVYQTKTTVLAASLRQKVISGILPKLYGDKLSVENKHVGSINHTFTPSDYVPRAQRLASSDVVDAEFKELPAPEERPDIAALRAMVKRREAEIAAGTHQQPDQAEIARANAEALKHATPEQTPPDSEDLGLPTARGNGRYPEAPMPPGPPPPYARAPDPRFAGTRDPHNPSNRAAKVK